MICHKYKVIFIHQRKCAGGAVNKMFEDDDAEVAPYQDGILDPLWRAGDPYIENYLKFTVVRNPWARFVSAWRYLERYRDLDIKYVLQNLPRSDGDKQERHDYRHITRTQSDLIVSDTGLCVVDEVIRFENLEAGLSRVFEMIGKPWRSPPKRNVGAKVVCPEQYRHEFYDQECCDLFQERFGHDIARLGYDF